MHQEVGDLTRRIAQAAVLPVNQAQPAIRSLDNIGKACI
jgi:hypothetical protein